MNRKMTSNNETLRTPPVSKITLHNDGTIDLFRPKTTPKKASNKKFHKANTNKVSDFSSQLLANPSFTLWENAKSPVSWKGMGINRVDDVTNARNGKPALRMPPNSYVYQFISNGLQPNAIYWATVHARVNSKNLNVPLVVSIQFFNEVGGQVGYQTQIIVDHAVIDANEHEFTVYAEAPKRAKTASLKLSVDASDGADNEKSYVIDEITFVKY